MVRSLILSAALVLAIVTASSALFYPDLTAHSASAPAPISDTQPVPIPEEEPPTLYVLRAQDGELCVFRNGELLRRTGVKTSALPAEDRAALENGISATSQQALTSLLEDLCS